MTAPAEAPAKGKEKAPVLRPFVAGTRRGDKATYDQTKTMTVSSQDLPVYECEPNGFLGGAYILVECTTAANAAATTFKEDGPFSAIDSITFSDTNNKPIVGPLTGHDLYELVKHGGYSFIDDAKQSPVYSATTGAGATGGSFAFALHLPIEISKRDGLGSLPNKSSSATYDITLRLAASGNVYGVAPTTLGSVRVRVQQWGWMDPNSADMRGQAVSQNPPAVQTTQYWHKQTYTLAAGAFNQRLIGIDGLLRNLLFIMRDSAASRSQGDSDFPDRWELQYETAIPVSRLKTIWRHMISQAFGYTGTVDTGGGRDNGVYPEWFTQDFQAKPGSETRLGYLPFSSATTAQISGTIGGSGTHSLTALVNKVIPAGGDPMALTGK